MTGIQSIEAQLSDFDRQMMTCRYADPEGIATNYPDLFSQLKSLNILRSILEGSFPEDVGDPLLRSRVAARFGINHEELLKLLGKLPENININISEFIGYYWSGKHQMKLMIGELKQKL